MTNAHYEQLYAILRGPIRCADDKTELLFDVMALTSWSPASHPQPLGRAMDDTLSGAGLLKSWRVKAQLAERQE